MQIIDKTHHNKPLRIIFIMVWAIPFLPDPHSSVYVHSMPLDNCVSCLTKRGLNLTL